MEKRVDRICSFLMACLLLIHISCTENSRVEDLRKELPENIQSSLQELYPDEIPQSTEQIIDSSTEEICYYVSFSDGTYFVFNAAGEWTSIHFNSKELPASIRTTYEDAIRQIEAETTSPIQALDKTYMVLLLVWKTKDGWLTVRRIRNYWVRKWNITQACSPTNICRIRCMFLRAFLLMRKSNMSLSRWMKASPTFVILCG